MPVSIRGWGVELTWLKVRMITPALSLLSEVLCGRSAMVVSSKLFHALHSGQQPIHFMLW
jgi:hypothetical protein